MEIDNHKRLLGTTFTTKILFPGTNNLLAIGGDWQQSKMTPKRKLILVAVTTMDMVLIGIINNWNIGQERQHSKDTDEQYLTMERFINAD